MVVEKFAWWISDVIVMRLLLLADRIYYGKEE
jgi:hypothetical protein